MSGWYGNYQGSYGSEGHSAYLSTEDDAEATWNLRHIEEDSALHSLEGSEGSPQQAWDRASAAYSSILDSTLYAAASAGQPLQHEQGYQHPDSDTHSHLSFVELVPVSSYGYGYDHQHQFEFTTQPELVEYVDDGDNEYTNLNRGGTASSSSNWQRLGGNSQNVYAQAPTSSIPYRSQNHPEGFGGGSSQNNVDLVTVHSQYLSVDGSAFPNTQEMHHSDVYSSSSLELQPHHYDNPPLVGYTSMPTTNSTLMGRYEEPWSTENTRQGEPPMLSGIERIPFEPQIDLSDTTESIMRSYDAGLISSVDTTNSQTSFYSDIEELIKSVETVRSTHPYRDMSQSQSQPTNLSGDLSAQTPTDVEARLQRPLEIEYQMSLLEGTPPPLSDNLFESNIDQSNLSFDNAECLSLPGRQGPSSEPASSSAPTVIRCDKDDCRIKFSGRYRVHSSSFGALARIVLATKVPLFMHNPLYRNGSPSSLLQTILVFHTSSEVREGCV
ncbi:hypothetical protein P153DRAFT_355181 [Dothidotthia symphoricarpi CBS 119687]|uniref:Uncharacterized protein n=1 Tax=Dothidotthia symphoricarpi CBS 119687 TaxID=1392245 RepID=A0A6A6AJI2_9PLEO|nr:uncharacterized protein P153DRAFT_355181 [Dothidotthia symphoricarpi CBS 119687]KAF2131383.1 hypothetical protein P153DRAFT_355181 [Dothidotthia symphoricarpi CBS 119687]